MLRSFTDFFEKLEKNKNLKKVFLWHRIPTGGSIEMPYHDAEEMYVEPLACLILNNKVLTEL